MQSKRPNAAARASPQANLLLLKLSGTVPLPSRWTWARGGITSSEGGVSSRLPRIQPTSQSPSSANHGGARERIVTTRETTTPKKPKLKSTAASKQAKKKQPRVRKPRPPHPQQSWWSPPKVPPPHSRKSRSPSPPFMCGADSSATHVHLFPPHRGSSPSRCPEDGHSF